MRKMRAYFTVFVTNLPSAFDAAYPHAQRFRKVRVAVGLHPLSASTHTEQELTRFRELVTKTSFIGEVGLDFLAGWPCYAGPAVGILQICFAMPGNEAEVRHDPL